MSMIDNDWLPAIKGEYSKSYYRELFTFVKDEYSKYVVYPPADDIFNAFHFTPLKDVKVLILGQDPYHEEGQAHGLCFSVKKGIEIPPSLVNIYKELKDDMGIEPPAHGHLKEWAKNGVLLLNTCLTVRAHQANSHKGKGWEIFTDKVIELLNERKEPMVFILWGANARSKKAIIKNPAHLVLEGAHPSPLSAYKGFFGGKYFSAANDFLSKFGEPVKWAIEE